MGWSQNSQGSITVSGSGSGLLAVGLARAELTIEELVDLNRSELNLKLSKLFIFITL